MDVSIYFHGSYFHQLPWRLLPPTSSESSQLAWKLPNLLPFTSVDVAMTLASFNSFIYFRESFHLLPPASMEASTNFDGSWKQATFHASTSSFHGSNKLRQYTSIYFHRWESAGFHGRSSSLRLGLELVLWKQLEICDTRESRWKYVGVHGISWKLPRNIFVEAAIHGSNGRFHFHRHWNLPCTPMEASTNFHESKPTSTNFH